MTRLQQKQCPSDHFDIENVSTHHEVALFKWVLILPDGKVTVKGQDCIRFSPAGKIATCSRLVRRPRRPNQQVRGELLRGLSFVRDARV